MSAPTISDYLRMLRNSTKETTKLTNELELAINKASGQIMLVINPDASEVELVDPIKAINDFRDKNNIDFGKVSDGYHTFDELYHHRTMLFAALVNSSDWNSRCWKSHKHHDPNFPMYKGYFIVGMNTEFGQATYHIELKYWDTFKCTELETAPEFDDHTPEDAINRIAMQDAINRANANSRKSIS